LDPERAPTEHLVPMPVVERASILNIRMD
jgi:hypothetical protein